MIFTHAAALDRQKEYAYAGQPLPVQQAAAQRLPFEISQPVRHEVKILVALLDAEEVISSIDDLLGKGHGLNAAYINLSVE